MFFKLSICFGDDRVKQKEFDLSWSDSKETRVGRPYSAYSYEKKTLHIDLGQLLENESCDFQPLPVDYVLVSSTIILHSFNTTSWNDWFYQLQQCICYLHKPNLANERKKKDRTAMWSFHKAHNPKYRAMVVLKQPHRDVVVLNHPHAELIYLKFIFRVVGVFKGPQRDVANCQHPKADICIAFYKLTITIKVSNNGAIISTGINSQL